MLKHKKKHDGWSSNEHGVQLIQLESQIGLSRTVFLSSQAIFIRLPKTFKSNDCSQMQKHIPISKFQYPVTAVLESNFNKLRSCHCDDWVTTSPCLLCCTFHMVKSAYLHIYWNTQITLTYFIYNYSGQTSTIQFSFIQYGKKNSCIICKTPHALFAQWLPVYQSRWGQETESADIFGCSFVVVEHCSRRKSVKSFFFPTTLCQTKLRWGYFEILSHSFFFLSQY